VESNAAEAEDGIAGGVGLGYSDVASEERVLERIDAFLGVVGHHREVAGGRRWRAGDLEGRAGVCCE